MLLEATFLKTRNMLISKTTFLEFLMCPKNIWLKLHRPELLARISHTNFA